MNLTAEFRELQSTLTNTVKNAGNRTFYGILRINNPHGQAHEFMGNITTDVCGSAIRFLVHAGSLKHLPDGKWTAIRDSFGWHNHGEHTEIYSIEPSELAEVIKAGTTTKGEWVPAAE